LRIVGRSLPNRFSSLTSCERIRTVIGMVSMSVIVLSYCL
jgi:hypothetical protein